MIHSTTYDIIIIGAGIVGLSLAVALTKSSLKIAVVESQPYSLEWPEMNNFDLRVSAINRASQHIFSALDVWKTIQTFRISPYREMHVWDWTGGSIHFDSADIGEADLGHIVENRVMQNALLQKMLTSSQTLFCPAKLQSFIAQPNHVELLLDSGETLTAKLAVAADGAKSCLRELANITMTSWGYHHTALVANVKTSHAHREMAQQRFLATGPLAFLPLRDSQSSSIVWSTTPSEAQRLLNLDENVFRDALANAFEYRLGTIESVSPRLTFPLTMQHAHHYVKPRIALIGDAAHTLHPLAGQGMNLGLLDAACLAEIILDALAKRKDIGAYHVLRRYERWRKGHTLAMIGLLEGLKHCFEQKAPPLQWLRHAGLSRVNQTTWLKNTLIQQAMGLAGDLPELARPNRNYSPCSEERSCCI